jgi:hypothetical protein
MKSQDQRMLGRYACLIIFATAVWPSAGWARPARYACDVNVVVPRLLQNWADQLKDSTPDNTRPIVGTYGANAVLMPTCKNGPLTGGKIADYFKGFLADTPVATFDMDSAKIGGTCANPFASGLYTFRLGVSGRELKARFTYIFQQTAQASWRIAQHHSSLEPESNGACPD